MNRNYYIILDNEDRFLKVVNTTTLTKLINEYGITYSFCCTRYCDEVIEPYMYIQAIRLHISGREFFKLLEVKDNEWIFIIWCLL